MHHTLRSDEQRPHKMLCSTSLEWTAVKSTLNHGALVQPYSLHPGIEGKSRYCMSVNSLNCMTQGCSDFFCPHRITFWERSTVLPCLAVQTGIFRAVFLLTQTLNRFIFIAGSTYTEYEVEASSLKLWKLALFYSVTTPTSVPNPAAGTSHSVLCLKGNGYFHFQDTPFHGNFTKYHKIKCL